MSPAPATDPGVKEALGFLMTGEIAHQKSFERALYAITPNFPPGKLPGRPEFTSVYYDMSQEGPEVRGAWNSGPDWNVVSDREQQVAADGGDGHASVKVTPEEDAVLAQMAARTASDPTVGPPLMLMPPSMLGALQGGAMAALATAVGTMPVLLAQKLSQKVCNGFLGLGAGVMLAATSF